MARPRSSPPEADAKALQRVYGAWARLQRVASRDAPRRVSSARILIRAQSRRLR